MDVNPARELKRSISNAESRLTLAELRPDGIKVCPSSPQGALEDMIRNAPGAIAIFDEFGFHLEVSDEYCDLLRLSRLDVIGKGFPQLLNEIPKGLTRALEMTLNGETILMETVWPFGDARGSVSYSARLLPWRRNRRSIGGSILFLQPLAKPAATSQLLPTDVAGLLEEAPGFLATTDGAGRIRFINAVGRTMLGMSSIDEAQHHEMENFCWKSATAHIHSLPPNTPWMGEMLLHNPRTSQSFPMSMLAFNATGADGRSTGSCYYGVQLSGKAIQEQAAKEPQTGLKLDTVCRATREIAHDLNNMLLIITGYASVLMEELQTTPQLAPRAVSIHNAGVRGAELTQQLLALSQKHS
jgi:hypothetical protein